MLRAECTLSSSALTRLCCEGDDAPNAACARLVALVAMAQAELGVNERQSVRSVGHGEILEPLARNGIRRGMEGV